MLVGLACLTCEQKVHLPFLGLVILGSSWDSLQLGVGLRLVWCGLVEIEVLVLACALSCFLAAVAIEFGGSMTGSKEGGSLDSDWPLMAWPLPVASLEAKRIKAL